MEFPNKHFENYPFSLNRKVWQNEPGSEHELGGSACNPEQGLEHQREGEEYWKGKKGPLEVMYKDMVNMQTQRQLEMHREEVEDKQRQEAEDKIDATGQAKDYVEAMKNPSAFDMIALNLDRGMKIEGAESFYNFENWYKMDSIAVARIFEMGPFFPRRVPGRRAFIDGLEQNSEDSKQALNEIVELLKKYFATKREIVSDVKDQKEKRGALTDTIGGGLKTLLRNFNRGSGTEKLLIIGAIGISASLLWKFFDSKKDKPFLFPKFTLSNVAKVVGVVWGVNYLSGKVLKDGRSISDRIGISTDIENFKNRDLKGFAYKYRMDEDAEKLRSFLELECVPVADLFRLYEEAASPSVAVKEIDPKKLGFYKGEVDGKAIYEIMEALVRQTALNKKAAEKRKSGGGELTENEKELCKPDQYARDIFKAKYINGEIAETNPKFIDVVTNEINTGCLLKTIDPQAERALGLERKGYSKAGSAAKGAALAVGGTVAERIVEPVKSKIKKMKEKTPSETAPTSSETTPTSIDPTEKNVARIHGRLSEIMTKRLPLRYESKFSGETIDQYAAILQVIPEAVTLKAITENGSENELVEWFSAGIEEFRNKQGSFNVDWIIHNAEWKLQGENPSLNNRIIKPRHKTFMANEMKKLENYYRNRFLNSYGKNKYYKDMVRFLDEVKFGFYREYFLNKAIVENETPRALAEKYSEFLKKEFRMCIKDTTTGYRQRLEDKQEVEKRKEMPEWAEPVKAMAEHVNH